MSYELRYPNITAPDEKGQLVQVKSYLRQLVEQLQWALNDISASSAYNVAPTVKSHLSKDARATVEIDKEATFNAIKSLIIKSADIVNAYYDKINKKLEGEYIAQSDFGTFTEQTTQDIEANSQEIESLFTNIQTILTDIENIEYTLIEVNAHIRSGLLYTDDSGIPIYGLEIGQKNTVDGEEVFNKYARFTSDRLSFYDHNDSEVAYISDYKLYITNAEITGTLKLGAFLIDTTKGFNLKYVGRG